MQNHSMRSNDIDSTKSASTMQSASTKSDRLISRTLFLIVVLMISLILIPNVMTVSSNLRMTLDTRQISPGDVSQGYS